MVFGKPQKLNRLNYALVYFGSEIVGLVDYFKYLGIFLDKHLIILKSFTKRLAQKLVC